MWRIFSVFALMLFSLIIAVAEEEENRRKWLLGVGHVYDWRTDIPGGSMWVYGPYLKLSDEKNTFIYVDISGTNSLYKQGTYEFRYYRRFGDLNLGFFDKTIYRKAVCSDWLSKYRGTGISLIYTLKVNLKPLSSVSLSYYYGFPMKQIGNSGSSDISRMDRFYIYLNFNIAPGFSLSAGRKWVTLWRGGRISDFYIDSYKLNFTFRW